MRKKQSLFQAFLLRIHYKASLALVSVLLGVLSFSGFYFFGQHIVNEADEQQRIARIQMNESRQSDEANDDSVSVPPTLSEDSDDTNPGSIGGIGTPTSTLAGTLTVTPAVTGTSPTATPTATPTVSPELNAVKFILGDPNTEKSIVAYYDFECTYCAAFVKDVLPQLKREYVDTGKVKILFKNFPLSSHQTAPIAHNAAMCASVKGNFWAFHDILFAKQNEWAKKSEAEAKTLMKTYFKSTNVVDTGFDQCVDNDVYENYLEKDKNDGKNVGVTGTPTFIIGNEIIVGYQPIESFRAILDAQ
ncbi:MAG TPA: thioredoxin domain-containing protein [Candidatus Levybacteria bacterium]|nr:thioredoxin domain-containing protein [Candidatus Levybacteria bacterium]